MLMRALENIGYLGVKRGDVFSSSRLSPHLIDVLVVRSKIAPVEAPPIAVMSDFADHVDVLVASGIKTLADVVEAVVVEGLSAEELNGLQCAATEALVVKKTCGCKSREEKES